MGGVVRRPILSASRVEPDLPSVPNPGVGVAIGTLPRELEPEEEARGDWSGVAAKRPAPRPCKVPRIRGGTALFPSVVTCARRRMSARDELGGACDIS